MSKRSELVLPPGTYAYSLDRATAKVSVLVGPMQNRLEETEGTIVFDETKGRTVGCPVDRAVRPISIVPTNHFAVLRNPYVDAAGGLVQPHARAKTSVDDIQLRYGETIHVRGPTSIVPWPGQQIEVRPGYWLTSDSYVTVTVTGELPEETWAEIMQLDPTLSRERDVVRPTIGARLTVAGTRTRLFLPPTGIEVSKTEKAACLDRLSWCCFVSDDGTKRFVRGPGLMFPRPDERLTQQGTAYDLYGCGVHVRTVGGDVPDGTERFETRFGQPATEPAYYWPTDTEEIVSVVEPITVAEGDGIYVRDVRSQDAGVDIFAEPCRWLPSPLETELVRRDGDYRAKAVVIDDDEVARIVSPTVTRIVQGPKRTLLCFDERVDERLAMASAPQPLVLEGLTRDGIGIRLNVSYRYELVGDDATKWFARSSGRHRIDSTLARRFVEAASNVDAVDASTDMLSGRWVGGDEALNFGDVVVRDMRILTVSLLDQQLCTMIAGSKRDETVRRLQEMKRCAEREDAVALERHTIETQRVERAVFNAESETKSNKEAVAAELETRRLEQKKVRQDLLDELVTYELDRETRREQQRMVLRTQEQEMVRADMTARAEANVRVLEALQPDLIAAVRAAGVQTSFAEIVHHLGPAAILQGVGLQDAIKRIVGEDAASSLFLTNAPDKPNGGDRPIV